MDLYLVKVSVEVSPLLLSTTMIVGPEVLKNLRMSQAGRGFSIVSADKLIIHDYKTAIDSILDLKEDR